MTDDDRPFCWSCKNNELIVYIQSLRVYTAGAIFFLFLIHFNSQDPHIGSTENARIVRRIGKNEQWRRWGTSIFRTFIHRIIACMHFICTLCGIFFLHSRLTHSLPHRSLLFMQFSIYNNSYFRSFVIFFRRLYYPNIPVHIRIHACAHTQSYGAELAVYYWTHEH